jgi:hypothetical protein
VESTAQVDLHGRGYEPRVSRDKASTAFAQLAALRLNVERGMVSLIDGSSQYILAEATKDTSVNSPADLWLGTTILDRPAAVCEHCFVNTAHARDQMHTVPGLIVDDCRLDDRFRDRPYARLEPGVRFYAGVPIVSRNGAMIGAYAVSDERPRAGLSEDELRFMHETAQAVMEHLEWARYRVDRFKGNRIVRGMASFIEGCGSLNDETLADDEQAISQASDMQTAQANKSTARKSSPQQSSFAKSKSASNSPPLASVHVTSRRPSSDSIAKRPKLGRARSTEANTTSSLFVRAADILRESTLADGAAIFGASAASEASHGNIVRATTLAASDTSGNLSSPRDSPPSASELDASDFDSTPVSRPCSLLAYSLAHDRAKQDIERGSALTLGTFERYFKFYPHGRVFYFSEKGHGLSSEDEASVSEKEPRTSPRVKRDGQQDDERSIPSPLAKGQRKRHTNRMDHRELLKKIPGATSVVLMPLYDSMEEKLMAGCFPSASVAGRMMNLDDNL